MTELHEPTYVAQLTLTVPDAGPATTVTVTLAPADTVTAGGRTKPLADCTLAELRAYAGVLEAEVWDTYQSITLRQLEEELRGDVQVNLLDENGQAAEEVEDWLGRVILLDPPARAAAEETAREATEPPTATAAQLPKAPAKPRSACAVLAMLLGGILLLGLIVIAAGFAWFTLRSPEEESTGGGTIPTIEGEPVLGTGDVQITLRWDNSADLDLHVIDPSGEEIWFLSPTSTSGGQLDVDANGTCDNDPAVENIYWPAGGAPTGNFQVSAVYYGSCDSSGPANYDVTVLIDGQIVDVQSGTLAAEGESSLIGDYQR